MVYIMGVISVLLGSTGQLCLKLGVSGGVTVWQAVFRPYTLLGIAFYVVGMFFWLSVLRKLPLSTAYPLLALNYVMVFAYSAFLLKEQIEFTKICGVGLIVAGIILTQR